MITPQPRPQPNASRLSMLRVAQSHPLGQVPALPSLGGPRSDMVYVSAAVCWGAVVGVGDPGGDPCGFRLIAGGERSTHRAGPR